MVIRAEGRDNARSCRICQNQSRLGREKEGLTGPRLVRESSRRLKISSGICRQSFRRAPAAARRRCGRQD